MEINEISAKDIQEIIGWKYDKPYDCYNYPEYSVLKRENWAIVNEEKNKIQFRSLFIDGKLVSYFRVQTIEDYILLGLGLKPEYCDKGLGKKVIEEFIEYIKVWYKNFTRIKLSVRKFNIRAIKCYKSIGFNLTREDEQFFEMELLL